MITLHRLGHPEEELLLNPDLIVSVESKPDTVITLATSAKVIVADSPTQITEAVRCWRVQVLSAALRDRPQMAEDLPSAAERSAGLTGTRGAEPIRALGHRPTLAAIGGGS
jgi:uncharacterized protein YlzI (FlbEa/FlbD family)